MILTTSMGFQVLRKEVMLTAFEAREKLLRLWASALQTRSGRRDKRDSRRSQPQRLNKGTKRRNCKHKKSGCVCFIVVRLCAAPLRNWGIWANKALCAAAESTAKLRTSAKTHKNNRNKIRIIFFPIRTFHQAKRGAKKRDCPIITANKGTFHHLPPDFARHCDNPFAPAPSFARLRARARVRAFSRFSIIAFTVHLLPLFHSECDD